MADSTASNNNPQNPEGGDVTKNTDATGNTTAEPAGQPRKRRATRSPGTKATKKTTRKTTRKTSGKAAPEPVEETPAVTETAAGAAETTAPAEQPRKRRVTRSSGAKTTKKATEAPKKTTDRATQTFEGPDADSPVEQAVQATAAAGTAESAEAIETTTPAGRPRRNTRRGGRGSADKDTKMANPSADPTVTADPVAERAAAEATGTDAGARKKTKRAAKRTMPSAAPAPAAEGNPAADLDRAQLGEKTRVHVLAKALGLPSRDLIVALDALGVVKVAQSSLSRTEAERLLDALAAGDAPEAPVTETVTAEESVGDQAEEQTEEQSGQQQSGEPVEKIRTRVRKNVANEIHQIEEKVEAGLAAVIEEHGDGELLEDVTPEITPKPESTGETAAQFVPLFMAPKQTTTTPAATTDSTGAGDSDATGTTDATGAVEAEEAADGGEAGSRRRRRGRRGAGRGRGAEDTREQEQRDVDTHITANAHDVDTAHDADAADSEELPEEPVALKGSTRLESQKRRRAEMREEGRKKRHIVTQAEFLARRESVERTMIVRERQRHDHPGLVTQVGVLEDDLLVEHFVTSEAQSSMIGNIYLGRVQNVLPSMEAAFIDIGKGRNGVLYAGEVDWKSAGLGGRSRRIEQALKSGDQVLVQVTKDPVGHKGARLTTQISLAGRYLVYVPGGRSAGISRKLPGPERKRLKEILGRVVPAQGGAIIRTAAENVPEDAIAADVNRLHRLWEDVQTAAQKEKGSKGAKPVTMYEEPDMLVKVVRDLFNEDFSALVVDGDRAWKTVHAYVKSVAPDLLDRVQKYDRAANDDRDAFEHFRVDEQLQKALARKVWLPSGGTLIIERTEAMTVVDVNTGKFTGSGGNLEETVTRNNLEAAEEIVRQMRLRDIGGMIVVDFIDMVLPENQDLVLRRLTEALGRDRTRHQVSEVTSLGLVQMTRKRVGTGLLETFSTECEHCAGRGLILHDDPVEEQPEHAEPEDRGPRRGRRRPRPEQEPVRQPAAATRKRAEAAPTTPAVSSDSDIEELAASVIVTGGGEDTDGRADQAETGDTRRSRAGKNRKDQRDREEQDDQRRAPRRGRRGRSRDRSRDEEYTSDLEEIVSAAVDLAAETDPDEPSSADLAPQHPGRTADVIEDPDDEPEIELAPTGEKSFQQAVADWERSPRRRRRTRGNSRSDHRPNPEDFAQAPTEPVADWVEPGAKKDDEAGRAADKPAELPRGGRRGERADGRGEDGSSRRRGRRRGTTRNESRDTGTRVEEAAPDGTTKEQSQKAEQAGRRGRRRAVRRTTTPPDAEMQRPQDRSPAAGKPQKSEPEQAAESTPKGAGRGRRRVVRRTSSS